jgi:hypothetical protein
MKCEDCLYYYRDEDEGFSRCHFVNEGWGVAPCEEDDWYFEEDDTEITYDELEYEP